MSETCETCRFSQIAWNEGEKYVSGFSDFRCETITSTRTHTAILCRRHAPRMAMLEGQSDGWPIVYAENWCGEYQPRKETHQ